MASQLGWLEDRDMAVDMATRVALGAILAVDMAARDPGATIMATTSKTTTSTETENTNGKFIF